MATATLTPATIAAKGKARGTVTVGAPVAPSGDIVVISTHAAAVVAAERLTAALAGAKGASDAVIVARYGADIDSAAVRLAKRAAMELAGGDKSRGEARQDILAVIDSITKGNAAITDMTLVAAARIRLDSNSAAKRARREQKKTLAAKVNDSHSTLDDRAAALAVLVGMDDADDVTKEIAAVAAFKRALATALKAGISADKLINIAQHETAGK